MKDTIIVLILTLIMTLNTIDVFVDIELGVPIWHIIEEISIVIMSAFGAAYLIFHIRRRTAELHQLSELIQHKDVELENISAQTREARKQYSLAIHDQFISWGLTKSEREVALFILKGFTFKEIAIIRDTKEKTVRQQASSIYEKSGVEGRHAFAAWFMEDLLVVE